MRFIDEVKIEVRAGNGGKGATSFRREKYVPKGGPDGGDGGRGGHVMFVASRNKNTLQELYLRKRLIARNGESGKGSDCHGKNGEDIVVEVPVGTIVKDEDGHTLVDLSVEGGSYYVARGGEGGMGNARFATSTNRAPRYAQPGLEGEQGIRFLELKLMADVGLVGLPNSGKSTLLARLSAAKPKIADYPFTTLVPNLGIVRLREFKSFVLADIPGIIEGASEGKGLGIQFLKHIQRTRLIVFLVDLFESGNIEKTLEVLRKELKSFDSQLAKRPHIVALNKIDLLDSRKLKVISKKIDAEYILCSASSGKGMKELLDKIEYELDRQRPA